jgi:hypothetical protein
VNAFSSDPNPTTEDIFELQEIIFFLITSIDARRSREGYINRTFSDFSKMRRQPAVHTTSGVASIFRSVATDAMGLFVIGHEVSHAICRLTSEIPFQVPPDIPLHYREQYTRFAEEHLCDEMGYHFAGASLSEKYKKFPKETWQQISHLSGDMFLIAMRITEKASRRLLSNADLDETVPQFDAPLEKEENQKSHPPILVRHQVLRMRKEENFSTHDMGSTEKHATWLTAYFDKCWDSMRPNFYDVFERHGLDAFMR